MSKQSLRLDRDALEPTRSEDPMLLYFTSGTTGPPKMVLQPTATRCAHEVTARFAQALTQNGPALDRLRDGLGQGGLGQAVRADARRRRRHPVGDPRRASTPTGCCARWSASASPTFCAPPTVYRMLIQQDLSQYRLSLRHCMSAGEPLNPEVSRSGRTLRPRHLRLLRPDRDGLRAVQLPVHADQVRFGRAARRRATTCASSTTRATSCRRTRRATSPSSSATAVRRA